MSYERLEYDREMRKSPVGARCQWLVETCASRISIDKLLHVKPCQEPAVVCTMDGDIPKEVFCGEHGAKKENQGLPIYLIQAESWYGDKPFVRATFKRKTV